MSDSEDVQKATAEEEQQPTESKTDESAVTTGNVAVNISSQVADDATPRTPKTTGTDKACDSDKYITWTRDEAVKIRFGTKGIAAAPAFTVMSMVKSTVDKVPNHKALAYKVDGKWEHLSYMQYYQQIRATAKACIKAGLEPFHGVAILGFNSKEWFYANYGAIFAGGLSVGIYTTNSADAVAYVINTSKSQICVVENDMQLQKVLSMWDEMPTLKVVVQYSGNPSTDKENVYSWDDFVKLGKDVSDETLKERIDGQYVNKCCSLIYTSGTTGKPKGVMLSHDNITYAARVIGQFVRCRMATESIVSYLPLSHIAAQMLDMYLPMCYAATVNFAQPDALKGTLNDTMKETLPTIFFGVPRVFEKMQEKIKVSISEVNSSLKKKLLEWARGNARKTAENMKKGHGPAFASSIAYKILNVFRAGLGLSKARYIYAGAAPLNSESHDFFASIGLPVMEVYGMSECTGASSMTTWVEDNKHWKPNSAGYRMPGYDYKLLDKDEKGNGEIAMVGRHVFMGYLDQEEKTVETFDSEYRLKSGDIGITDSDGFLFISGRIKELLITAGGENVAPVPIEDNVKEALPQVSNCMLIGDKRKFLSVLISLKTVADPETLVPTENFTQQTIDWCKSIGSSATKVPDVLDGKDAAVTKAIQEGINKANAKSESNAKRIAKFAILSTDFSVSGGELGPTLKLKRPVAAEIHAGVIEKLYED